MIKFRYSEKAHYLHSNVKKIRIFFQKFVAFSEYLYVLLQEIMFLGELKNKMRLHNDFSLFLNPNQSNYETDQTNVCSVKKDTKYSSVLLLRLVSFFYGTDVTYTLSLFCLILDGGTSILDMIFQFQKWYFMPFWKLYCQSTFKD